MILHAVTVNIVVGATNFEDIKTVDGVFHSTYKEACFHRGLLDSDKEWHMALGDASPCASASQLRGLFVTVLVFCEIDNPLELWNRHWANLSNDVEFKKRKMTKLSNLKSTIPTKQMLALREISELLR